MLSGSPEKCDCVDFANADLLFASAFEYASIGMALVAPDGRWLKANKSLCALVGYTEGELLAKTFQDITHPDDLDEDLHLVSRLLAGQIDTYQMEKRYFHKSGRIIFVLLSVSLVRNDAGRPLVFISQIQDVTARKELEQEMIRRATMDALTGVYNRRGFFEYAARETSRAGRFREPLTLLMIDIDHFKEVNDAHGHDVGDEVLKCVAALCKQELRTVDVFGRLGGEEFGALLVNTDTVFGRMVAERLRQRIAAEAVECAGITVAVTVSVGVAAFAGDHGSLALHLKQADMALYEAKKAGRNRVAVHIDAEELDGVFENAQSSFIHLVWKKQYECGQETIDAQHRCLFELSNELLSAVIADWPRHECERLILNLVAHVSRHFSDEEAAILAAGYPLAEEHRAIHQDLAAGMDRLVSRFFQGDLSIGDIFSFLAVEVIAKHLLKEDRKFFPCFFWA